MLSSHKYDMMKERAVLLYCIMKKQMIELGRVIQTTIMNATIWAKNLNMLHSSLITDLCQHVGRTANDRLMSLEQSAE